MTDCRHEFSDSNHCALCGTSVTRLLLDERREWAAGVRELRDELGAALVEVVQLRRVLHYLDVQKGLINQHSVIRNALGPPRPSDYGVIQPRCPAHSRRFCPECHGTVPEPVDEPEVEDRPSGAVPKGKPDASG